jgi:hypothetical protein
MRYKYDHEWLYVKGALTVPTYSSGKASQKQQNLILGEDLEWTIPTSSAAS